MNVSKVLTLLTLTGVLGSTTVAQANENIFTQDLPSQKSQSSRLFNEAKRELALMQTSVYQHNTDVDETSGRFNYDCSGFSDYALKKVNPKAYLELPISKGSRPLAQDFYTLFSRLNSESPYWKHIRKVNSLKTGDIIVWLRPIDVDNNNTGHVMIVKAKPRRNANRPDELLISVIDSTTSPHAQDSRIKGQTGLGTGVIGIVVNNKDLPIAYYWKGGISSQQEKTSITFGRLESK